MNRFKLSLLLLLFASALYSCSGGGQKQETASESGSALNLEGQGQASVSDDVSEKNILQIAVGSPDHTTLVAGVKATQLENVLANNGPLTVFAPNNAAFDKLPEGTLDELLLPENLHKLRAIITYHAAPGTFTVDDFDKDMELYQATGDYVKITVADGKAQVNGANIVGSVVASNGIVHVVDAVLLPPQ